MNEHPFTCHLTVWRCRQLYHAISRFMWLWINTYKYHFLVGWTSIYKLFWCSPGLQGFDTLPCVSLLYHMVLVFHTVSHIMEYDYQPWGRCKKIYKNIRNMSSSIPYPHCISCLQEIYPPAINRSNGKSSAKWRFNGKIIGKWGIVHCHVWLPEGRSSCSYDFPIFFLLFSH